MSDSSRVAFSNLCEYLIELYDNEKEDIIDIIKNCIIEDNEENMVIEDRLLKDLSPYFSLVVLLYNLYQNVDVCSVIEDCFSELLNRLYTLLEINPPIISIYLAAAIKLKYNEIIDKIDNNFEFEEDRCDDDIIIDDDNEEEEEFDDGRNCLRYSFTFPDEIIEEYPRLEGVELYNMDIIICSCDNVIDLIRNIYNDVKDEVYRICEEWNDDDLETMLSTTSAITSSIAVIDRYL